MNNDYDITQYNFPSIKPREWKKVRMIISVAVTFKDRPTTYRYNHEDYGVLTGETDDAVRGNVPPLL
jgi:hypothetical protein